MAAKGSIYPNTRGSGRSGSSTAGGNNSYGSRLLPQVLDDRAASNPDRVYATITLLPAVSGSYREVTYSQVARATNFFASWLKDHVDYGIDFETLAYMGLPDLRNPIIFLAAVKCGYKVCCKAFVLSRIHGLTCYLISASFTLSTKYCCYQPVFNRTDQVHEISLPFRTEAFSTATRGARRRFESLSSAVTG